MKRYKKYETSVNFYCKPPLDLQSKQYSINNNIQYRTPIYIIHLELLPVSFGYQRLPLFENIIMK
jgi:hypothetical protein